MVSQNKVSNTLLITFLVKGTSMKWLYKIFRLFKSPTCFHKWETLHVQTIKLFDGGDVVGHKYLYHLKCTCCGDAKVKSYKS